MSSLTIPLLHRARLMTGHRSVLPRAATILLLGVLPVVWMMWSLTAPGVGWDFEAFYEGARRYLAGDSPYPGTSLVDLSEKQMFVYPAPMAALLAPLALLPYELALALWLAGSIAAFALTLRVLGVHDWRILGALFLTQPVISSVRLGTLMPFLMLVLALLWRHRDSAGKAALLAAVLVVSKVFLWPVLIWLAATRRLRTAALATTMIAGALIIAWLPLGLSAVFHYADVLQALSRFEQSFAFSLTAFVLSLGASTPIATAVAIAAGGLLVIAAGAAGRRDDFFAFRLALAASFVLSPLVWGHYYVLLVVPMAVMWPRLSPVWLLALWIGPDTLDVYRALPLWLGLALVVLAVQLGVVPSRQSLRIPRLSPSSVRVAGAATVAFVVMLEAGFVSTGSSRTAKLFPVDRAHDVGGVAMITVDRSRICWRLWTDGVAAGPVHVTVRELGARDAALRANVAINDTGAARACETRAVPNRIYAAITENPARFRVSVALSRGKSMRGTLRAPGTA